MRLSESVCERAGRFLARLPDCLFFQRNHAMTVKVFNVLYVIIVKLGLLSKFVAILVG